MPDLSPAAQAVKDAVLALYSDQSQIRDMGWQLDAPTVAAALRAAMDQVVPEQTEPPCGESEPWPRSYQLMADSKWEQRQQTRIQLLAIADELQDA